MPEPLTSWVADARARWPGIVLDEDAFAAHLARLGPAAAAPAFPLDAYLAAACSARDPAALRAFDEQLVARLPEALRRVDSSPAFASEIQQEVRLRLLLGEGEAPPRIARYTGAVPLSAWLRVVALRLAYNAKRGKKAIAPGDAEHTPSRASLDDPEVEYLRAHYKEPFERAFERALAELPKDDRTILRLHYVDGVNIDGIGRVFQVHRATIARWLVRIRGDVLARAKAHLAEAVGADVDEADSVLGAVAADVDVTLSRVLGRSA